MRVHVVGSSCVPQEIGRIAVGAARILFCQIGVAIRFTRESPEGEQRPIILQMWEHAPANTGWTTLGMALPAAAGGGEANVYFDRLQLFADGWDSLETGKFLGYLIAHELGHVLRGDAGRALIGVMATGWKRDTIDMSRGEIYFTHQDALRISRILESRRLVPTDAARNFRAETMAARG